MKKLSLSIMLLPLASYAAQTLAPKVVTQSVKVKPQEKVRIAVDRGVVKIQPSASEALTYEVTFRPNEGSGWLGLLRGSDATQKDLDDSSAAYAAGKGLTVTTGRHLGASVKIGVPKGQSLSLDLDVGTAEITAAGANVEAKVGTGVVTYDASALPADACIDATVKVGVVSNKRDVGCKSIAAKLHAGTGTVTVN